MREAGSNRFTVDDALLARFPRLAVVSNQGVGVDHIHLAACAARGVRVGNTPAPELTASTADVAFALLLAVARRVVEGDALARAPGTRSFDALWFGPARVSGATLGVVGCGRIGQAVARRARGFDMPVLYHNRARLPADAEAALGGARFCAALGELLAASDFVVLCAPSTPATRGLMGAAAFAQCKRGAVFVNVARGDLVDQAALAAALRSGALAGAGLDVTTPEPLPRDHELFALPNCVITPHVGTATLFARAAMNAMAVENLAGGLAGGAMPAEVVA